MGAHREIKHRVVTLLVMSDFLIDGTGSTVADGKAARTAFQERGCPMGLIHRSDEI